VAWFVLTQQKFGQKEALRAKNKKKFEQSWTVFLTRIIAHLFPHKIFKVAIHIIITF